ncbi:hypothetical protein [Hymenobacter sp. YC55]|uniref:hypothetical protein n=1 Tax=Hymenobacter sp. YC55 TaxID=3034019 RepID=UPI0023F7441E|nr:hypothetical protein [Hymenobacter sp. YC55]MDF7815330.1 hypothetical protein [Hymenobacter sp. YC55]
MCQGLGDSLHNYGHDDPLSEQRRLYLGALGNILKYLTRGRFNASDVRKHGPRVMGWVNDEYYRSARTELSWAPEELRPLLDGLTLQQVNFLTLRLLDVAGTSNLTDIFARMGSSLLTHDGKSQAAEDKRLRDAEVVQWQATRAAKKTTE